MISVTRQRATAADDPFLFELFVALRGPDFSGTPIPPAQLNMLMQLQYAAQKRSYSQQYPDSDHDIVLVEGSRAARIWISLLPAEHRLVDISILPAYQSRGIGTGLVVEAIENARQAGVPLRCSVALSNAGSLRFHQRLGFRIVSQDEVYAELEADRGEDSGNAFAKVLPLLLRDGAVREKLIGAPDLPVLFAIVLAFADTHGLNLREQDLQATVNANRRSWLERWIVT